MLIAVVIVSNLLAAESGPTPRVVRLDRDGDILPEGAIARIGSRRFRDPDPERSRAFYEALGMEFRRESPIVRNGETEATLYFYGFPGQEEELELTLNSDGRSYELGTAYGHIAIGVDDLTATLDALAAQGIEPEKPPYQVREGGSFLCFVQDPDGYRIEIIGRG